jgi:hypothetical protein
MESETLRIPFMYSVKVNASASNMDISEEWHLLGYYAVWLF